MKFPRPLIFIPLLAAAAADACTIPVFRYALDRWRADAFSVLADEGWKTSETGKKVGALISEASANLVWSEDEADGEPRLIWARGEMPVEEKALTPEDVAGMAESPVRDEIAKRILAGASAVWVMVDSGDGKKDAAFAQRLAKRLKYLESVAAIPPQDPDDPESQLGPGPELKVGFSMLRVKRDDAKERLLTTMVAGPMGEKLLEGKVPFAAPVFGRGRVLGAWNAEDLDDAGIDEVSLFLLGACSCRVKAQNPGWDLLMNVDWDERLLEVENARRKAADKTPPPPEDSTAPDRSKESP